MQIGRQSIELAVDQADGIPTMIGEKLTQMAVDETNESEQKQNDKKTGQTLYF